MKKTAEQEVQIKLAVRDLIVRNPLISGHQLCRDLAEKGLKTSNGNALDWHYVAKLVRRCNREKALAVDQQKIGERLTITKERYRVIIEKLRYTAGTKNGSLNSRGTHHGYIPYDAFGEAKNVSRTNATPWLRGPLWRYAHRRTKRYGVSCT